jgi:putative Ca2+/H+ antiporter (TMEM165/GDT1 family)
MVIGGAMAERRRASSWFAGIFGLLIVVDSIPVACGLVNYQFLHKYQFAIDAGSCFIFGAILIWWAFNKPEPAKGTPRTNVAWKGFDRGIGNETVVMVVAVVTGVITIFTLMHIADDTDRVQLRCNSTSASEMICTPADK